jgi:beta-galactosidase
MQRRRFISSRRHCFLICLVLFGSIILSNSQTYIPPTNGRVDINLDPGWKFIQQNVSGAQAPGFDDSSWTNINLPHTWDIVDGQSYPSSNYYTGISWYRVHFTPDASYINNHFFLKFDGAFRVTDVYLNGIFLGEHQGGFAAFVFDVTPYLNIGSDNVLAVEVNNSINANIPPLGADFTFWGGIYRDVHLLVTSPVHISPIDWGSPGVYLKTTSVSAGSANLQVTTVVSNSTSTAQNVTVRSVITDAATNIVTALTNNVLLPASSVSNVVSSTVVNNPHLWNGRLDPYLYQAFVELRNSTGVVDMVAQPLGFRWFSVDPTNGFFLNGQHYDLHGVNMHQDWLNCGWALTNAQRDTNFVFLKDIGATFLRLSHYEHNDYTYQLADQNGICVWSEVPLIDNITESPAFYTNTLQQLREMIRQRYNHPSIIFWSVYNEITLDPGPLTTNLINQEVQLVNQEDTNRLSTAAANTSISDPSTFYTQVIAFNQYFGWYSSPVNGIAAWADNVHATYPNRCVGVSEYGAGASIYQHSENPTFPANTSSTYHPEEWQNLVHETNWQLMAARPFLWCKLVWNEFDFASDGRNEGDTPGRNDKGLATYDRQVRKDAFYFYKANWNTNPMVYITGHTFTNRFTNVITAKVYANCDSVTLYLNGVSKGPATSGNCIYTWPITLQTGTNFVTAIGTKGSTTVTDSLIWIPPISPPVVSILSPIGAVAYLVGTNDNLLLSASVSNPIPAFFLATVWSKASGPGTITFANSNSLITSASFSTNGLYGLSFTANNGAIATVPVAVSVGSAAGITNGLLAWWKMNDGSGTTAADSSGNSRTAIITGAFFTNYAGIYPSNALRFNGSSSYASFASPSVTQLTLIAWARAYGSGNSAYPRIFDTPGYRLFYRFDNQGTNGFDYATYSTGNGDWFSGANTISTGAWYRVAASYDLSNLAGTPSEYVNGISITPNVITTPSGTQPSSAGTGYIGNAAAANRAWNGDLSDLRIYNRILSGAEIQVLSSSSTNYAPSVFAGTNQTIIWPNSTSLTGSVTNNGNAAGTISTTWSQTGGPSGVQFANSNSISTSATFPTPGTYQLQLAASAGQATTISSLSVNVVVPGISVSSLPGALQLTWPGNNTNWLLQYQSNSSSIGLSTNWIYLSNPIIQPFIAPIYPGGGSIFYRLVLTNQ